VTCPNDCSKLPGRSKPPCVPIPATLLFASASIRSHEAAPTHKGELAPSGNMTFSRTDHSLAQKHGMQLATLDEGIKHQAAFVIPA